MRPRYLLLSILTAVLTACQTDPDPTAPPPIVPEPATLLRDVVVQSLPSPYYHFDYDAGSRVSAVSFASGLTSYDVTYDGDRIAEMRNNTVVNHDRLTYFYDTSGRLNTITEADANGSLFATLVFTYDGRQLTGVRRTRRINSGFVVDKRMSMSYYPDGNVLEITERRPAIEGVQDETTVVDRYEQYDDKVNVDGFDLIHDDFFDHFVLLPDIKLQQGNPGRVIRTGDGLNFTIDYRYTYDGRERPLTKVGAFTLTNGDDAGRQFESTTVFSYY